MKYQTANHPEKKQQQQQNRIMLSVLLKSKYKWDQMTKVDTNGGYMIYQI